MKKAYYKLSLKVHPDRVPEEEKDLATEKFKVLSKIFDVLTDKSKKALYDEKGIIDDDDCGLSSLLDWWAKIFKPITISDIDEYKEKYQGSEDEKIDVMHAYLDGKGCWNYLLDHIQFMNVEDEPRIYGIIKEMIDNGIVGEYDIFSNEPPAKKERRHRKYNKEVLEQRRLEQSKELDEENDFNQTIMRRQEARGNAFAKLLEKYENMEDDSEVFDLKDLGVPKSKKKRRIVYRNKRKV